MANVHIPFDDIEAITRFYGYKCTCDGMRRLTEEDLEKQVKGLIKATIFERHINNLCEIGEAERPFASSLHGSRHFVVADSLLKLVSNGISERVEPYFHLHTKGVDWLVERFALDSESASQERPHSLSLGEIIAISENDDGAKKIIEEIDSLLIQLKTSNNIGQLTEEDLDVVGSELLHLKSRFEPGIYSSSATLALSEPTLNFIASKAAGTLLATAARAVISLIFGFFGLTI